MTDPSFELEVLDVIEETGDARSVVLDPGEHREHFGYTPGQFLTVAVPSDRTGLVARSYSLSSTPVDEDGPLTITVKRTVDGYASGWICSELRPGDRLRVLPPSGIFTPKDLDADLLLFAGGSGITPVMSIIRTSLARGSGRIVLFYANRDERSVIFHAALAELAAEHPDRLQVVHWLESVQGLPSQAQLRAFAAQYVEWDAFVCGPAPFMAATVAALKELEFPRDRRHQEKFVSLGGNPFETAAEREPGAEDEGDTDQGPPPSIGQVHLQVELDGVDYEYTDWRPGTTLLEHLESKGVKAPYSCREGECSACAIRLLEGEVTMRANDVLDDEDLADGIRLGCQSEPASEKVRVTYCVTTAQSKNLEIPAEVRSDDVTSWSDEVDVVVVGAGMAGTAAAIEAAEAGARVLVLDRGGRLSATSAMAGGHFYLGGGTPCQEVSGYEDTPAEMAKYLMAVSPDCDPEKIRLYSEGSVEHFHWLESLGFEFERTFFPHKSVMAPGTEGVMFTGNEKVWPFHEVAVPAPRGHQPPVVGDSGGGALVLDLALKKLEELGVEVRFETGATALVTDGDGVVGVAWKRFGETGAVRAGAVVIAAGGFVMNPDMVHAFAPPLEALIAKGMALGNTYDDGLGIRLGESVGGVAEHMDGAFLTAPFYPPGDLVKGICVNSRGERFVAEDSYHSRTSAFVFDQPEQKAWLILDSVHMAEPAYGLQPLVDGWETIAEMEVGLGVPEGSLARTLDDYNAAARDGDDPAFHKAAEYVAPLDVPPYGAYDLTPGQAFYSGFTCGGLRVDPDARVLREDRTAVAGLYAAGACASNIAVDGRGYASGTQLGEASFFGRRAGRHAASVSAKNVTQVTQGRYSSEVAPAAGMTSVTPSGSRHTGVDGHQEETWA